MEEGELIGSAKFRTTKNGKDFIYELYLYFLDLTSEFRLVRRWYYQDNKSPPRINQKQQLRARHIGGWCL